MIKAEFAKKPALAIRGEVDRTLHVKHFLPLFSQVFPNGQVLRLPGAGHYSPRLSGEAADLFQEWRLANHHDDVDAFGMYASHIGKLPGLTLRLALGLARR